MAVPAPVITVVPNSVTRTYADPTPSTTLTDTNAPTPAPVAPNGREFRADGVTVATTTGTTNSVIYKTHLAPGVRAMTVRTTNADGNATSTGVNLTVTDSIATGVGAVPYRTLTDQPGKTRLDPNTLPNEYKDPTLATPGLPTAIGVWNARIRGVI